MKRLWISIAMAVPLVLAACGGDCKDGGPGKSEPERSEPGESTSGEAGGNSLDKGICEKRTLLLRKAAMDYCEKNKERCKACECFLEEKVLEDGECALPATPLPEETECQGVRDAKQAERCLDNEEACAECSIVIPLKLKCAEIRTEEALQAEAEKWACARLF